MDASGLGTKIKLDEGQRTILSEAETKKITSYFKEIKEEDKFLKVVKKDDIKKNNYIIQAGQYFEIKAKELDFDLDERLDILKKNILNIIDTNIVLDKEIIEKLLSEDL